MALFPPSWPEMLLNKYKRHYPEREGPPYGVGMFSDEVPPPFDPQWYQDNVVQPHAVEGEKKPFGNIPLAWSMGRGGLIDAPHQNPGMEAAGASTFHPTYQGSMLAELPQTALLPGYMGDRPTFPPAEAGQPPADPRYGIQQGADEGFGAYQASAADFGEKQPQQGLMSKLGGLFGGGPQNINLALLQAGLGTMAAGGWQKMPVTLGQAIGQGSYPSVQTQIEQNKWDEQRGMREEELNIRRMTGEAYRDQLKAQAEDRKQAGIRAQRMEALNTELQAALAAGDGEKAKKIARSMAFYDNPESAYKTYVEEGKGPKLELKKLPKKGPDGKPMIDPRTGDQIMEAWWVDPQGNKIRPEGDVIGSGGVRVSVGAPQMFDPTQSAFDVETKLRNELEPQVKNSKAGIDLARQFDSAIALDTPSGYKAAATIAQKLIEPGNQALINEISRLEGGGDLVERVRGSLSQFITGTPSQQQIDDMKKFAKAMEGAYRNQAIKARKQYKDLGTKYQGGNQYISPDRIVLPDDELDSWEALSE
jgi:hypothetical protein